MSSRDELKALVAEHESYPQRRAAAIRRAKADGLTWKEIAEILGMKSEFGAMKAARL